MNISKKYKGAALVVTAMFLFGGCSALEPSPGKGMDGSVDLGMDSSWAEDLPAPDYDAPGRPVSPEKKTIESYSVQLETVDFVKDLALLRGKTEEMKGYVDVSNVWTQESPHGNHRVAQITLRIPEDGAEDFMKVLRGVGNLLRETSASSDVTAQYTDIAAQIKSLEAQEIRMTELYQKAEKIEDILYLDEQIRMVIQRKEQLQRSLLSLDTQVSYARVEISMTEVSRLSTVEAIEDSLSTRAKNQTAAARDVLRSAAEEVVLSIAFIGVFLLPFLFLSLISFAVFAISRFKKRKKDE